MELLTTSPMLWSNGFLLIETHHIKTPVSDLWYRIVIHEVSTLLLLFTLT